MKISLKIHHNLIETFCTHPELLSVSGTVGKHWNVIIAEVITQGARHVTLAILITLKNTLKMIS